METRLRSEDAPGRDVLARSRGRRDHHRQRLPLAPRSATQARSTPVGRTLYARDVFLAGIPIDDKLVLTLAASSETLASTRPPRSPRTGTTGKPRSSPSRSPTERHFSGHLRTGRRVRQAPRRTPHRARVARPRRPRLAKLLELKVVWAPFEPPQETEFNETNAASYPTHLRVSMSTECQPAPETGRNPYAPTSRQAADPAKPQRSPSSGRPRSSFSRFRRVRAPQQPPKGSEAPHRFQRAN